MNDDSVAPLDIRQGKEPLLQRVSLIWLVPLFALAISLWAAYQTTQTAAR